VNGPVQIVPLDRQHDRKNFSCGVDALDRYLRELALQDVKRRISNCFVAMDTAGAIVGYYTLAACSIPLSDIPEDNKRQLPRYGMISAALIGRLAVDGRYHGKGLGGALVIDAALRANQSEAAIFALLVDAKDSSAAAFYRRFGFQSLSQRPLTLLLPLATALRAYSLS
jgi:predicted N-acetyltransferase YhbS